MSKNRLPPLFLYVSSRTLNLSLRDVDNSLPYFCRSVSSVDSFVSNLHFLGFDHYQAPYGSILALVSRRKTPCGDWGGQPPPGPGADDRKLVCRCRRLARGETVRTVEEPLLLLIKKELLPL